MNMDIENLPQGISSEMLTELMELFPEEFMPPENQVEEAQVIEEIDDSFPTNIEIDNRPQEVVPEEGEVVEVFINQDGESGVLGEEQQRQAQSTSWSTPEEGSSIPWSTPEEVTTSEVPIQYARFKGASWFEVAREQVVVMAGLGGIGSWVNLLLSRIGPQAIYLYDPDSFEPLNLGGQFVSTEHLNQGKANIASYYASLFSNYPSSYSYNSAIELGKGLTSNIMICGFDNMKARKAFFTNWLNAILYPRECLFIDGRLTANMFQIFCIRGDDDYALKTYQDEWLFEDEKADETDCTFRQTSHLAAMIASYMVTYFTNFCDLLTENDKKLVRLPWFTQYNSETNLHDFRY